MDFSFCIQETSPVFLLIALYVSSQMFSFDYIVWLQNKTFEKLCMGHCMKLWISRNIGLKFNFCWWSKRTIISCPNQNFPVSNLSKSLSKIKKIIKDPIPTIKKSTPFWHPFSYILLFICKCQFGCHIDATQWYIALNFESIVSD